MIQVITQLSDSLLILPFLLESPFRSFAYISKERKKWIAEIWKT